MKICKSLALLLEIKLRLKGNGWNPFVIVSLFLFCSLTILLTLAPLDDEHPLQIFVKCLNGKCITINVASFDNRVCFIKDALEAVINIPVSDQVLTFGSRLLKNQNALSMYNVQQISTPPHISASMPGGVPDDDMPKKNVLKLNWMH